MANDKKRFPMDRSQRAKQFAPFDALTGLGARLKQAEEEHRSEMEEVYNVPVDSDAYDESFDADV